MIFVITIIVGAIISTLLFYTVILIEQLALQKFVAKIFKESENLYFHGMKLIHFLAPDTFYRLQEWLKSGLCYELSALVMLLLKNHRSARICHGACYDKDGNFFTTHAWVEVRILLNWYVIDIAWMYPWIRKRRHYFRDQDGTKLIRKWTNTYRAFWDIWLSNYLWNAIQDSKTSHILRALGLFCSYPDSRHYGFQKMLYELDETWKINTDCMAPYYHGKAAQLLSGGIIRDFAKNPKRKSPKAKSVRIAEKIFHAYKLWKTQQPTA